MMETKSRIYKLFIYYIVYMFKGKFKQNIHLYKFFTNFPTEYTYEICMQNVSNLINEIMTRKI